MRFWKVEIIYVKLKFIILRLSIKVFVVLDDKREMLYSLFAFQTKKLIHETKLTSSDSAGN